MRFINVFFKILFLSLFVSSIYYIFYIATEKYESQSTIMIKDLSNEQSTSSLGSLLAVGSGSESMVDAKLLEVYIKSLDMFSTLDKEFNLTAYYKSDQVDILHRLSNNSFLPNYWFSKENLLKEYNKDLLIVYDEPSTTIKLGFAHANAKVAKEIVESIITQSSKILNLFENKNAEVVLDFLKKQEQKKHQLFISSLENLLKYQNQTSTIDPKVDINVKNKILAALESDLIKKEVEYNSKSQYLNANNAEMKLLKGNIYFIEKSIKETKSKITGKEGNQKLNVNMSDFTLLKSKLEFNKQLYIQTLVKLEETKVLVSQNTKNLIVVSKASVADSYTYPAKFKDTFSILMILMFIYGIIHLISIIIFDHKD
ncbi:MAG: Capsular polysaccharide export system inner membrane protein KpsE [uncultured Sulfurovum sp.]|uniref:Capsular polysaccharide export system inner membrane protein KpsE n=1 Tax=uncultured Sulfurovum sp. TaxID=269237 RepID=A0A6S6S8M4_9BACT|nr:MAG: Capsular polysaccharide export system inner membrane protein KpsE [uncultured Sulfurovum sp.]